MSGRGTAGGVTFQAWVGALCAALMLCDRPMQRAAPQLPGTPRRLLFESPNAVDDLVIETDVGAILVQAKRTLSLSTTATSELRSVAEQFVRQYRTGVEIGGVRRPLDPNLDRLVIAVGDQTASTVSQGLRDALDRAATGAATAMPNAMAQALTVWRNHLSAAWTTAAGGPVPAADLDRLVTLSRVSVFGPAQEALAVELLGPLASSGDGTALFDALCRWGADSSAVGTGGDTSSLRAYLGGRVPLAVPPSLRQDIERLSRHSAATLDRLRRFRTLGAPEGDLEIARPVIDAVASAAATTSLLVTGEPGAGKSAVLHAAAERLAGAGTVILLSVEATSVSQEALRRDIGLEHALIDVLADMPGPRPAYLLIDALDAARGGLADVVYRRLMEEVEALDGWRVIASVRSFDLRMGRDLRTLFAGAPPAPAFADRSFASVRHIQIPLLDAAEIAMMEGQSPSLTAAVAAGGPGLRDLVRNPFNLALLADLLVGGIAAPTLSRVTTRGQLLERYWLARVEDLGAAGVIALTDIVERMVEAKAASIREAAVPITAAATIDALAASGVLVRENTARLSFRHHVLFDYAVARLVLAPDTATTLRRFSREAAAGLLLAPALGFWLDERYRNDAPEVFWGMAAALVPSSDVDPVVRVEVARLIVEAVESPEMVDALAAHLDAEGPAPAASLVSSLVIHLIGALQARASGGGAVAAPIWAGFAARARLDNRSLVFAVRLLVNLLLDQGDPAAEPDLGLAARRLMDVLLLDETLAAQLSRSVIPLVARTYATDPAASRARLEPLFETGRFGRLGYLEAPWLAREIRRVAAADPEFAEIVYRRTFGKVAFDRDQSTHMGGGWIMSFSSNAAQDFDMAKHALSEAYPGLLEADPMLGARLMAAALQSHSEAEHARKDPSETQSIEAHGKEYRYVGDWSAIWDWRVGEGQHEDWGKIGGAFIDWAKSPVVELTPPLIDQALEVGDRAVVWRALLAAASHRPEAIATHLWPLVTHPVLLRSDDADQPTISALAAIYPFVGEAERVHFERLLETWTFEDDEDPDGARFRFIGKVFNAIGAEALVLPDSRTRLAAAIASGVSLENDAQFSMTVGRRSSDEHEERRHGWMRGARLHEPPSKDVLALVDQLDDRRSDIASMDAQGVSQTMDVIETLWAAADSARDNGLEVNVDRQAGDTLASLAQALLAKDDLDVSVRDRLLGLLVSLAGHPLPEADDDTEENFAKHTSWSSPSPRVRAAEAIGHMLNQPDVWPRLATTVERLVREDPHPAVRMQLAACLNCLWETARPDMWRLIEAVARDETNIGVLRHMSSVLNRLRGVAPAEVEALYMPLLDRVRADEHPQIHFTALLVNLAIWRGMPASLAKLAEWLDAFDQHEPWLAGALGQMRDIFVVGFDDLTPEAPEQVARRERALTFVQAVITAVKADAEAWPARGLGPPEPREIAAFKLIDSAAEDLFYATGAGGRKSESAFASDAAAGQFLDRTQAIIAQLGALGSPRAVHHLLQMLQPWVDVRPALCFDLMSGALLRTGGVARYEYESLGAALFVELVGRYLADHRDLFEDDARRRVLLDCIAVFVEAGWPEARRLFQSLPELFG